MSLCLEQTIEKFHGRSPYKVVSKTDSSSGECVFTVRVKEAVPPELSSIIGDIVHNLRSALDILVCDLIRAAGNKVTQSSGFPISTNARTFPNFAAGKLKGTSAGVKRLVGRLKPYPEGLAALRNIHTLDNEDKHSRILVAQAATLELIAAATMPFFFTTPDGGFRIGGRGPDGLPFPMGHGVPENYKPIFPLADNSEIYRGSSGFVSEIQCGVYVAFGEGEVLAAKPVLETLKEYADLVERIVVMFERFAG